MEISKTAQENAAIFFDGQTELLSTLQATDPDYVAMFENLAFDETQCHVILSDHDKACVTLAALLGVQGLTAFKAMVRAALRVGVTPVEIKEIIYHTSSYLGMARVVDFILAANDIFAEADIVLPLDSQATTTLENRHEEGLKLKKGIFKELITQAHNSTPADQMHMQDCLTGYCFGDLYTRSGLDLKLRQLITFAVLLGMGDCEKQLKEHIEGNFNLGNDRTVLLSALTQCMPYIGFPRCFNTLRYLNEVQKKLAAE